MFGKLYDWVMKLAKHEKAQYFLALLSFTESSFFLVPPDVMLAPMALSRPEKAYRYALITTVASVVGGVLGYLIGMCAFEVIKPYLIDWGYYEKFLEVKAWAEPLGVWAVFMAGFTPFPYKIITISAGVLALNPISFVIASIIGRGSRFFLVAGLLSWGGEKMEKVIRKYIEWLGWAMMLLCVAAAIYYFKFRHGG